MSALVGWIGAKLVAVVLPALGTVIAGYVIKFLDTQLENAGMDLSEKQEAKIRQIIADAIKGVEEKASTQKLSSDQKLEAAVWAVRDTLPEMDAAEIVTRIHQQLPDVREPKKLAPLPRKGTNGMVRN